MYNILTVRKSLQLQDLLRSPCKRVWPVLCVYPMGSQSLRVLGEEECATILSRRKSGVSNLQVSSRRWSTLGIFFLAISISKSTGTRKGDKGIHSSPERAVAVRDVALRTVR